MRVAVLFSGGKDSTYAVSWVLEQGFDPILITVRPPDYSMMFHHPNIDATALQAKAMGRPHMIVEAGEEDWRQKLIDAFRSVNAQGIATGAVASEYQKSRIDSIATELGIPAFSPLWHKGEEMLDYMVERFEIYVVAVAADGLGPELLGGKFSDLRRMMKKGIHPFLEGGEGETFVADAPFFRQRISIKRWKKTWDGVRGVAHIEEAHLEDK
jgi:predicted ATP pyrophosphatase (TIGR00289 family)